MGKKEEKQKKTDKEKEKQKEKRKRRRRNRRRKGRGEGEEGIETKSKEKKNKKGKKKKERGGKRREWPPPWLCISSGLPPLHPAERNVTGSSCFTFYLLDSSAHPIHSSVCLFILSFYLFFKQISFFFSYTHFQFFLFPFSPPYFVRELRNLYTGITHKHRQTDSHTGSNTTK